MTASVETVADIASEVGLSMRALEDGYLRYFGTPPMSYLRQVRMSRAHDELVSADPDLTTATNHRAAVGARTLRAVRRRVSAPPRPQAIRDIAGPLTCVVRCGLAPAQSEHSDSGRVWPSAHNCCAKVWLHRAQNDQKTTGR
jgi:hypothetical protein